MLGFSSSGVTEMVSLARVGLSFSTEGGGMWKISCCVEVRFESRATRRGDRIRTCDLPLPKRALYQAELRPESLTQLVDSPTRHAEACGSADGPPKVCRAGGAPAGGGRAGGEAAGVRFPGR